MALRRNCKYIKMLWPEYQEYMEYPEFRDISGYDAEEDAYYIPEYFIEEIVFKDSPGWIEHDGVVYITTDEYKKGDEVLMGDLNDNSWVTKCTAKGSDSMPDIFEDTHGKIPYINCWILGVRKND